MSLFSIFKKKYFLKISFKINLVLFVKFRIMPNTNGIVSNGQHHHNHLPHLPHHTAHQDHNPHHEQAGEHRCLLDKPCSPASSSSAQLNDKKNSIKSSDDSSFSSSSYSSSSSVSSYFSNPTVTTQPCHDSGNSKNGSITSTMSSINQSNGSAQHLHHQKKNGDYGNGESMIKINGTTTMATKGGGRRGLRILICTESFHPYTSGIARRFKEIIRRLADRGFLIHIITGCRVN
jgi:hypothetical protein